PRRHPEPATPPPPRAAGGSPDNPGPPTGTPAATFARALSTLQRESGLSHTDLGAAARVDRSYISRIVIGERLPSWKVTRRFADACGADPEELRPLWDAARGYRPTRPGHLGALLRGMHLASGLVGADLLHARTGNQVSIDEINGLLAGTRTADWPTVEGLVTAMRAEPATVRPLWEAATTPHVPQSLPPTPGLTTYAHHFG
ncbi:helix-turn-helix domain-containing protein, partial [Streptomyces sp. 12297]